MATAGRVLFDLAGLERRSGRYGQPVLGCLVCGDSRRELVIDGQASGRCWPCHRKKGSRA